ncbi:flagellar hook-basal body complex protein FliE 2 [Azorhizobium oxalatiphilum]|uniref:Flagellar hook-basal body complex protein FliE n=1 Tax=Azorhizobium oxalatiphilum TaxID=980631 RepID=A0A917BL71_9HYPH|nr:flagellar hook-basal body complex protein FliE [Azorhizobium oxalatiphilum]GGF47797.1 flagellar hook-basal body complex protein FliE 2 [Azorhizobium oxalatiphilum]
MIESITSLASSVRTPNSLTTNRLNTSETSGVPSLGGVKEPDFSEVLASVSSEAIGTLRKGEATAISGIQGKASVQQVVEAVMSAEQTLQTALAVRDKVVAAYQEVSRMAI